MKALTLTQPWATLVALGAKRVETRSWGTHYRGPLAIHAAKGLGPIGGAVGLHALVSREPFRQHVYDQDLPLGAIVAVVQLANVVGVEAIDVYARFMVAPDEEAFGDYSPGRSAWLMNHPIIRPPEPIPCRGALSLWDVPLDIEARLSAAEARPEDAKP